MINVLTSDTIIHLLFRTQTHLTLPHTILAFAATLVSKDQF